MYVTMLLVSGLCEKYTGKNNVFIVILIDRMFRFTYSIIG